MTLKVVGIAGLLIVLGMLFLASSGYAIWTGQTLSSPRFVKHRSREPGSFWKSTLLNAAGGVVFLALAIGFLTGLVPFPG